MLKKYVGLIGCMDGKLECTTEFTLQAFNLQDAMTTVYNAIDIESYIIMIGTKGKCIQSQLEHKT